MSGIYKSYALLILSVGIFLTSCDSTGNGRAPFDYGTKVDSARYYFLKGWEEILDNGRWTESEMAFRKAVEFDPNWLLGKSLVGRITRDPEEKQNLLKELQLQANTVSPDERMLLEVNLLSIGASVNRDRGVPNSAEFNQSRRELAEKNFGTFARKYPEDDYFKAEYIEFLHANHGAQTALDSLKALAVPRQMKLGFYIGYQASLELELGNVDKAIVLANEFEQTLTDPSYLSPKMLRAQILQAQDSLLKAKALVETIVQADSNHVIALGTLKHIQELLEER